MSFPDQDYTGRLSLHVNLGLGLATGLQPVIQESPLLDSKTKEQIGLVKENINLRYEGLRFLIGLGVPISFGGGNYIKFNTDFSFGISEHFKQFSWNLGLGTEHNVAEKTYLFWSVAYYGQLTSFGELKSEDINRHVFDSAIQHGGSLAGGLGVYLTKNLALEFYFGGKLFQAQASAGKEDQFFDTGFLTGINLRIDCFGKASNKSQESNKVSLLDIPST